MRPRAGGHPSASPVKAAMFLGRAVVALCLALVRKWPATFDEGFVGAAGQPVVGETT